MKIKILRSKLIEALKAVQNIVAGRGSLPIIQNVLMEASATARPVIATNISGCREVVEDNVSGILFEPRSTEALTEALEKFMAIDEAGRREMGKAARRLVEQKFDRRSIILTYINEIKEIII